MSLFFLKSSLFLIQQPKDIFLFAQAAEGSLHLSLSHMWWKSCSKASCCAAISFRADIWHSLHASVAYWALLLSKIIFFIISFNYSAPFLISSQNLSTSPLTQTHTLYFSLPLQNEQGKKKNQTRIKQKKKGGKRERNEKHTEKP